MTDLPQRRVQNGTFDVNCTERLNRDAAEVWLDYRRDADTQASPEKGADEQKLPQRGVILFDDDWRRRDMDTRAQAHDFD